MNKILLTFLLIAVIGLTNSTAQDLKVFDLTYYEKDSIQSIAFISLSDIYPLSEHQDSLAIPDLTDKNEEEANQFEYFKLSARYRQQFLNQTKISETDKVFIYSYSKNKLISFPVSNLNVIACLNIYGAEWPYSQFDFMIGFEIDKRYLTDYEKYYVNTFVCIGKKSPFVMNQLSPIVWQKIDSKEFPSKEPISYDTSYAGKSLPGDTYKYEKDGLLYYVQELVRISDNWTSVKRLLVINTKTKKTICEKNYYSGESASFAPLDNQWTGMLFKNKPPVIFGFHYVSFGCPSITFINSTEKDIYINCDNRH